MQEIINWLNLVTTTSKDRDRKNYNKIIDLEGIQEMQESVQDSTDKEEIKKHFLNTYLVFCKNIARLNEEYKEKLKKEKTAPVVDSYPSLAYIEFLLDDGFLIVSDLLRKPYYNEYEKEEEVDANNDKTKRDIAESFPIYTTYKTAREILERKRNALFNYANPFDNPLNEYLPTSEKVESS